MQGDPLVEQETQLQPQENSQKKLLWKFPSVPLILLYRTVTRNRLSPVRARVGMTALLVGYVAVWAAAGLPVYAYALSAETMGRFAAVLPAVLLAIGGAYQFTSLKRSCHVRCSNPLFFLMQK